MVRQRNPIDHIVQAKKGRTYEERVKDPYRLRQKLSEPAVCPGCGAVFHKGRWQWGKAPNEARKHLCAACLRERDKHPAGVLTLSGAFFTANKNEIINMIKNVESKAKAEHPIARIMAIEEADGRTEITFTDAHLAHGVGQALAHAYKGDLDNTFAEKGELLQVIWKR